MSVCLLPLLCVLVVWSAAFPEATMGHTEELDLTATVFINQIAIHQLQEEQRGVQEGVRSMLMVIANMTEGVKERENATRRLLDTLDQLECVNKAHQADNLKLEEENTRLNTANHLLEEDNRKTKNEGQLAQEEIVLLKSQIRQVEEDSRLVKEEIRKVEEDSRLVKEEIRKVEEDSRLVKEDNMKTKNEVRLAQEENIQLKSQIRQVEEDSRLVKEDNMKTKNEVRLAQEENIQLKSQIRQVEEDSRLVKEEIRKVEEDSRLVKEEIRKVEEDSRLVKEDNMKTKNEVRLAQEENIQLKSQIRQVEEDSRLVKEDNMKTKNEVRLAQEENIQLKSQIRQVEEDSRLVKQEIRQVEEDSRLVKQEIRQVEEDSRLVKTRNQQLELAETQAQERVKTALTRIAELERETQQLQEMNNNTAREKGLVQEQLSLLEEQVRVLQTANAALNEEKEETIRKTKEEKRLVEEQLSVSEEEASKLREGNTALQSDKDRQAQQLRSTQEEHEKCKRNVSELYTRVTTAKDCADLYRQGERLDGVYFIKPDREGRPVSAWCDMTTDGGGWTVLLRRDNNVVPAVNFTRDWEAYKTGFGNASTEYWLGTEAAHQLTQPSPQTVRLAATNKNVPGRKSLPIEHRWALWSTFSVANESTGYQLLVDGYQEESTMGDVLVRHYNHSGMKFSTLDRDNDLWSLSCAQSSQGGWWYRACSNVYPTRPLSHMWTRYWTPGDGSAVYLQQLQLMTRPQNFPTSHQ
ncbi:angiopoietin-2-like isoform X1 [Procambarus clarkii]|uniref:angiopoietin-2-like isoform X1 n=1 Tax=Procambarus clarkii TaxID=6728 RepID=UPI0037434E3A